MNLSNIIKMRHNGAADSIDLSPDNVIDQDVGSFVSLQSLWQIKHGGDEVVGPDPLQVLQDEQDRLRVETEKMVAAAEARVTEIEEQAREKGFTQGREEGLAAGKTEFSGRINKVNELLRAIEQERPVLHKQYEKELLPLVKAVSQRLVNQEILTNPQVVTAGLREAMEYMVENSRVKVHLNPDDYANLTAKGLDSDLAGHKHLTLVADEDIAVGGCFLETDLGEIDATVEVRQEKLFAAVDQAFIAALEEEGEDRDEEVMEMADKADSDASSQEKTEQDQNC
jgi:flagellar assembly protein FliH